MLKCKCGNHAVYEAYVDDRIDAFLKPQYYCGACLAETLDKLGKGKRPAAYTAHYKELATGASHTFCVNKG